MGASQWRGVPSEPAYRIIRMRDAAPGEAHRGRILLWDIPARVTHWGFSLSLSVALWLGFKTDPESALFKYHMLAGIFAGWFLFLRICLGFVGTRPLRWRQFFYGPMAVLRYLKAALGWQRVDHAGLNPGSAAFALAIYVVLVALIWSGFVADLAEIWHGRLAWGGLGLIGAHLLGLTLHGLRHRELTPLAMVHGKVRGSAQDAVKSQCALAGLALFLASLAVGWLLWSAFDEPSSTLKLPLLPEVVFPLMLKG